MVKKSKRVYKNPMERSNRLIHCRTKGIMKFRVDGVYQMDNISVLQLRPFSKRVRKEHDLV